jgi:hypothetical protein
MTLTSCSTMSERQSEPRSFAPTDAQADEASRTLPEQIARLRVQIEETRAKLSKTARELARDAERPLR